MQIAARSKMRERRLQSARVRKYYDEYQVRQRSRMLKKRTKEELVTICLMKPKFHYVDFPKLPRRESRGHRS